MKKVGAFFAALAFAVVAQYAIAQTSSVNPNIPAQNSPMTSAPIRANFAAAANDINALYALVGGHFPVPVSQGGTGITSGTSGGIPYFASSSVMASSAALAQYGLVVGGGAGSAPFTLSGLGTTTTVLHGNASGVPSYGAVQLGSDVAGLLPVANGGTNNAFFTVAGPATSAKTYTFPNASANILTDNALVTGAQGGTGVANTGKTITIGANLITTGGATTFALGATGRTYTFPDAADTVVLLTQSQTLTNKTLTSPVLVTPNLGVASATSVAIGGATIGTDALAVAGTATFSGTLAAINGATFGSQSSNSASNMDNAIAGWKGGTNERLTWTSGAANGTIDTGFSRDSAGVIDIGNGALGDKSGSLNLTALLATGNATAAALIPTGSTVPVNGMYLSGVNQVSFSTNTLERLVLNSSGLASHNSSGFLLPGNVTASSTAPTLIPNSSSTTTGIGAQASGNMSLIIGGVEKARLTSSTFDLTTAGTVSAITASAGTSTTQVATTAFVNTPYALLQAGLTSGAQSISSAIFTQVALNTASIDSTSGFSAGSHWYVIPKTGTYEISGVVNETGTGAIIEVNACTINKNGVAGTVLVESDDTVPIGTSVVHSCVIPPGLYALTAADTIELDAYIAGSSATVTSGATKTWLKVRWISN